MSDAAKRKIAGIDLGTTYSAIAHFDEYGKVDIIPNSDNERITPSVILFEDDEVIVGKIAKNQAVSNPENVVQFVKRHMGEPDWVRTITGREYTPEILSAIILKRIVSDAEDQIGEKITDVVITCPAYFNDNERKATSDSGKIAGLNVLGIINEPTAAAIAYGMNNLDREVTALVYDLGGGTFDVTLLKIDGNNVNVLATDGERRLGGKDWDDMLLNHVADKFMDEHQIDPRDDAEAYQDLIIKVEEAKKALSKKPVAKVFAQCGGKSLKLSISREEFEELTLPLVEQTETYLDVVLKKADLSWDKIDVVIHVGGSTRMPAIRDMLQRVTGKDPEKGVNPDECVAIGAAYWAAIRMVREANQAKEAAESGDEGAASKAEETAKAVEESVPEDIVGMLGGVTVTNVNSHSLGIVTVQANGNERNLVMIPEQSSLPCTVTKIFGTYQDNQVTIQVKILEGESPDPSECTEIGMCVISDLPPDRPKGSKISVTYQYGEDGRIEIKARDHQTGQEARTEIKRDAEGLSDDEMEQKGAEIARLLEVGPEETYADGGYEAAAAPTAEAAAPAAAPEAAAPAGDAAGYEGAAGYTAAAYGAEGYGAAAYGAEGYGAAAAGYGAEGYAAAGYGAAAYGAEAGAAAAGYGAEGAAAAGYGAEAAAGYGAEGAAAAGYGAEGYAGAAYGAEGAAAGYGAEGYATEGGQAYGAEYAEGAYGAEQSGYTAEGYGGEYAEGGYGDEGFADSADQSAR